MLVTCVVRTCELLTDVVHTSYQIIQWHRTPFDERNTDMIFLHRAQSVGEAGDGSEEWPRDSESDSDEEEGSVESRSGQRDDDVNGNGGQDGHTQSRHSILSPTTTPANEQGGDHSGSESSRQVRLRQVQLETSFSELRDGRRGLWEAVEAAVVDLLQSFGVSPSIALEDFLCMLWALQKVVLLGKEYCGADSKILRITVQNKSVEYISELHRDYFQRLRQMVEAETWRSVP
eukprot:gene306-370_t